MGGDVRLRYPGLIESVMPSGNLRYLVRVEGDPRKRITLSVKPDHPEFHEIYLAARRGVKMTPNRQVIDANAGTLAWLGAGYLRHLAAEVEAGNASPLTLKQRANLMPVFLTHPAQTGRSAGRPYGELIVDIPASELILFRDSLTATPGKAKNTFKMLRAMFAWAVDRGHAKTNPAAALKVEYRSQGGARPWTLADLEAYRTTHPVGTMPHLCLTLFMFTAARISDVYRLGRGNEVMRGGVTWLEWTPSKRGAQVVSVPMLPPLLAATRAQTVVGPAYLMTQQGKPFASPEALRNKLKDWCRSAGLPDLSSHGIRKAAGHLLALHGATQHEIMAVHGHSNASTSEIYTRGVERQKLAESAVGRLSGMDW